jgi:flagellar motor switch protein FliN/FliY
MTDVAPVAAGVEMGGAEAPEGPAFATAGSAPLANAASAGEGTLRALPLEALHDVELNVEVVLGRARMPLRDLLTAHPGTTIELDRSVHSTVDVMVNGTLFARGEMVVVDDSEIGVQVTEVIGADMSRDGRP